MAVERAYGGTSLVDVLDRILDKGIVIDAWVRVSVVGLEVLTIEARVVVASVDTYLRYAHAIGLTPLSARPPIEPSQGQLDQARRGQNGQQGGGLLQGLTGGGQGGGLLSGVTGGQSGGQGGALQGVTGQLQGVLDQLQGGQGGQPSNELPPGVADQLRSIVEQLQGSQQGGGGGAQPKAPAGQPAPQGGQPPKAGPAAKG